MLKTSIAQTVLASSAGKPLVNLKLLYNPQMKSASQFRAG
jgi:hypothetical protein